MLDVAAEEMVEWQIFDQEPWSRTILTACERVRNTGSSGSAQRRATASIRVKWPIPTPFDDEQDPPLTARNTGRPGCSARSANQITKTLDVRCWPNRSPTSARARLL